MDLSQGLRTLRLRKPAPVSFETSTPTREEEEEESESNTANAKDVDAETAEPLSPAARLFHAPTFNCHIVTIIGCKTDINPEVIKAGLKQTMLKHPRFYCKPVCDGKKGGKMRWVPTEVNVDDHVTVPDVDPNMEAPDQFVEDYISNLSKTPMDFSKPLWELHLLNVKTSHSQSVGVLRLHHSLGDGISLMSLLLASTRKTSDPEALPTVPVMKQVNTHKARGFWWLFISIWLLFRLIWNTIVDMLMFVASMKFLRDTQTPVKGGPGVGLSSKRFVHRTVSLDDIKLVKSAMNSTINDVVLGITQAGLSRYLNRRYGEHSDKGATEKRNNLPKNIRLRAAILINIRPTAGVEALADMMEKSQFKWGNWIGYVLLPFTIALRDDPLDYIHEAKATVDRKKLSLEAILTFSSAKLVLQLLGDKIAAALTHSVLSNTTMSFSNMIGPLEDISFYGHPMSFLAPSVYGHPQALTVHIQSHVDKMTFVLAVDPDAIPDPHRLCDDFEESLKLIRDAVVEKRLGKHGTH